MAPGEPLLAAFLQVLLDQANSLEVLSFARRVGLRKMLDRWRVMLTRIATVLDDADQKQHTHRATERWLTDLRDLAYDVDDILDELATEGSMGENQASTSKVRKLIPICCTGLTPAAVNIKIRLGSKMKEITDRLNDMVKQKDDMKLSENVYRRSYRTRETLDPTSVMADSHVYGREKDKEAVIKLLLGVEYYSNVEFSVIPILGMGGIGKSTLAQLVYNDERVLNHFDLRAWACVSEEFDALRVTKAILKSVTSGLNLQDNDMNLLQVKLKEILHGKRYLVILDDVWCENYHDWTILRAPFLGGSPGSAIVITTRNEEISSMMGTIPAYRLQVLPDDACLSLFTQHVLGANDFSACPNLQDFGEEIVKRCKGLPLAVKTLGGLLRAKQNRDEWEYVLKNKIWDVLEVRSEIVPILKLSYHHLPSHLKRCFAYCSVLPKDYEFEEQQLVLLWMAEGLIHPQKGNKMEDLGSEYFRYLLTRSFFQQVSGNGSRFVMHELINDLAQSVAGDVCFRIGDGFERRISKRARHLTYQGSEYDAKMFEGFSELTCLRTFLHLMPLEQGGCHFNFNSPLQFSKLRCLRVLSLSGYDIIELSESIGDLKHLRYLDLSNTSIESLPGVITTLYNLQTLILENCPNLRKLPSMFQNLVNLRHLNVRKTNLREEIPRGMAALTCLLI